MAMVIIRIMTMMMMMKTMFMTTAMMQELREKARQEEVRSARWNTHSLERCTCAASNSAAFPHL
eukprot:4601321-Karenia_brevis.AAC.1